MISVNIEVEGINEIRKLLQGEPLNQAEAMIKAQSNMAARATESLKRGLNISGGAYPTKKHPNPFYRNSKKGELPLLHSGRLRDSIFYKNIAHKTSVETILGCLLNPPEYAIYLEGKDGKKGKRPFLWYAEKTLNRKNVLALFDKYYKPLQETK